MDGSKPIPVTIHDFSNVKSLPVQQILAEYQESSENLEMSRMLVESEHSAGSGDIDKQYTVWCSRCAEWHQESVEKKAIFVRLIKNCGWKKIKGLWVCPDCVDREENTQI